MRVTALVVSWNAAAQLPACVAALDAQDHPDLEILIVDNASTDGTADLLDALEGTDHRHDLRILRNPLNRGFAGAVNDGLRGSDADAVLFCNVDIDPRPDLVSQLVAALEADPGRGAVQPRLHRQERAPDGAPVIDTTGHVATRARLFRNRGEGEADRGQWAEPGEVFGVSGALALYRRAMLDEVAWRCDDGRLQWLTEDLFAYFEDVELDWRARRFGWTSWYEPRAVATHERGGAGVRRTATVEALNWSNRLLVVATCDDGRGLLRALPLVAATSALKTVELAVTVPQALLPALSRLRLLPRALARRRQLDLRAPRSAAEVERDWFVPFRWLPWIRTWWDRITRRPLGTRP